MTGVVVLLIAALCFVAAALKDHPSSFQLPSLEPPYTLLPGTHEIGSGYNVLLGNYADPASCFIPLFNFSSSGYQNIQVKTGVSYSLPNTIIYHDERTTDYTIATGQSITDYSSSLNVKTKVEGSYNFFSASISTDFSQDIVKNEEFQFSRVQFDVNLYTLQLPSVTALQPLLTASAKKDIDNMDPFTLFSSYGTHFLNSIMVGGRAVYSSSTNKLTFKSSFSLDVVAQESYKSAVGSLSAEEEVKYGQSISQFKSSSQIKITTRGGDPSYGGSNITQTYDKWAASVLDYPVLVDFIGDQSLVPIWNLASSPTRQAALHAQYLPYCNARGAKYPVQHGPYLRAQLAPLTKFADDQGGGAHMDVSEARPDLGTSSGWYYLGPVAYQGYGQPSSKVIVVQELFPGILADIATWTYVWNDHGSGKNSDYSLWRGTPDDNINFKVVGDFFKGPADDENPPDGSWTLGLKAVYTKCLLPGKVGSMIWDDHGTDAHADGSMWFIVPTTNASYNLGAFVSTNNYDAPTYRELWVLNAAMVIWGTDAEVPSIFKPNTVTYTHEI